MPYSWSNSWSIVNNVLSKVTSQSPHLHLVHTEFTSHTVSPRIEMRSRRLLVRAARLLACLQCAQNIFKSRSIGWGSGMSGNHAAEPVEMVAHTSERAQSCSLAERTHKPHCNFSAQRRVMLAHRCMHACIKMKFKYELTSLGRRHSTKLPRHS